MILKRFFQRRQSPVRSVYEAIVAAARHPLPYTSWGVADTVQGRFDMIALHTFLVLDRLKGEAAEFRQGLVDELFRDMDRSLREMGVGDLSVGKKVRKMAEAFYGRVAAYDKALVAGEQALEEALRRNLYAEDAVPGAASGLAAYVLTQRAHLAAQSSGAIADGNVTFQVPAA